MAAIRRAGLNLIYRRGYEAMSLRDLAQEAELTAGALYNHIDSKQTLLFDLVNTHMDQVLARLDEVLSSSTTPLDKLYAFIRFHLLYHIEHKMEVFIGHYELRSLSDEHRNVIVSKRTKYENYVTDIIESGLKSGVFQTRDARVAAFGIIAMLTGVCTWYQGDGRLTAEEVVDVYTEMVLKSLSRHATCSAHDAPGKDHA